MQPGGTQGGDSAPGSETNPGRREPFAGDSHAFPPRGRASTRGPQPHTPTWDIRKLVRDGLNSQLSHQKVRATSSLGSIATAVRQSSAQLRNDGQDAMAAYIDKAADQLEGLSSSLSDLEVQDLVETLQQFARRQPALFIGAAFGVGLLGARFLRSTSVRGAEGVLDAPQENGYALGADAWSPETGDSTTGPADTGHTGGYVPPTRI